MIDMIKVLLQFLFERAMEEWMMYNKFQLYLRYFIGIHNSCVKKKPFCLPSQRYTTNKSYVYSKLKSLLAKFKIAI